MNLKRIITTLIFIGAVCLAVHCQNKPIKLDKNKKYEVWDTIHSWGESINENSGESEHFEEDELYIKDYDLVRQLPVEIKTIIAAYTLFVSDFFVGDYKRRLASALGDFETLEKAQNKLLANLNGEIPKCWPYTLSFQKKGNRLYFDYGEGFASESTRDEFLINANGTVSYIPEPLLTIEYDRGRLEDDYKVGIIHKHKLNGEEFYFSDIFLDPDNIESVQVSQREKTVFITQKNKNTEYFSLSMIELDKLPIEIKSIKEFARINVVDDNGMREDYDKHTKIELSCIQSIGCGQHEEYKDYKWLVIKVQL